jgi:hypothetical protein
MYRTFAKKPMGGILNIGPFGNGPIFEVHVLVSQLDAKEQSGKLLMGSS